MGARRRLVVAGSAAVAVLVVASVLSRQPSPAPRTGPLVGRIALDRGWRLQSSADVSADGRAISEPGFSTSGWLPVTVPTTVLAGLVANHVYADPYLRTNLRRVPESAFSVPWWYRTDFKLPAISPDRRTWLHLDGINYRANVWVNGHRIATSQQVVGTFRAYGFDVTEVVRPGANSLAVEVFPVHPRRDLTLTWIDWNPMPPDRGMGIWHEVYVTWSGPVSLRYPHVVSDLSLPDLATADLTVTVTVRNDADHPVEALVAGSIGDVGFSGAVDLAPGESKPVRFDPRGSPQLHLDRPRVWWPYQMGRPDLYRLTLSARVDGALSDRSSEAFGIRDVRSELTPDGYRLFRINGRPIMIRGAGWAPDMMLRPSLQRTEDQLGYVRDLGLNAIRLEGKLESDRFYELTDRLGILVLPGWMCCDRWQETEGWTAEDRRVAQASMTTQALRLRDHPSVIGFLIGSDVAPPPDIEGIYLRALSQSDWPDPIVAAASDQWTAELGSTGLKMTGPYDWVPPSYWYSPHAPGGALGFNSETGPGASIPELGSLREMLSPTELTRLWRDPSASQFHAGTGDSVFHDFRVFDAAMAARLGPPRSLADYVEKAQVLNYEAERAEFEAFNRNKYSGATGVIHWMLNSAWPSLHWNLFDYFLSPNGSYFGAKKANEALHIQYSYDDRSVVVVNQSPRPAEDLAAVARVFDIDGTERFAKVAWLSAGPDSSQRAFTLPAIERLSPTHFVELLLRDGIGHTLSWNVYWLSTRPEALDWSGSTWYYTPTRQYADFRALSELPPVRPGLDACSARAGGDGTTTVTIGNRSKSIAFFMRLRLTRGPDGHDVLPVRWTDNYVTLMPGEQRTLKARYRVADLRGADPALEIRGWNVPHRPVPLEACR